MQKPISNRNDCADEMMVGIRRHYEEERKKRIFGLTGRDKYTLDIQLKERDEKRQHEIDMYNIRENELARRAFCMTAKSLEMDKVARMQDADMRHYRCYYQRFPDRREADLNDPHFVQNSRPARESDDDPRLSISGMQVFAGEDLNRHKRRKLQSEQQLAWWDQQIKEHEKAKAARIEDEKEFLKSELMREKVVEDMVVAERKVRHAVINKIRDYNNQLAEKKRKQLALHKQNIREDDIVEMQNNYADKKLQKRGRTEEEEKMFRIEEKQTLKNLMERREEAALRDKPFDQTALYMDRELTLRQLRWNAEHQDKVKELIYVNRHRAAAKHERDELYKKGMLEKYATDAFFMQFNRGSR